MTFEQRFGLCAKPAPANPPIPVIEIREEGMGVFVANCHSCGHVVGVRRTRAEVERDQTVHRCGEGDLPALFRYLSLT